MKKSKLGNPTQTHCKVPPMPYRENEKHEHALYWFSDWAFCYMKSKETQWKPSTFAKYQSILQVHLLPFLGHIPMEQIDQNWVNQLFHHLTTSQEGNNPLAVKTVNGVFSVLKNIMTFYAEQTGAVPCKFADYFVHLLQSPRRILSEQELLALVAFLQSKKTMPNLGIFLALTTGLRIGEVCALTWGDVDLQMQTLSITKTALRLPTTQGTTKTAVCIAPPKSDSANRTIPIPSLLLPWLLRVQTVPEAFLLSGSTKPIEPRCLQNHIQRAYRSCGIEKATFHTLRHTFATRWIEQGMDVKTLSSLLGHASVTTTLNCYVHPSLKMKQQGVDVLAKLYRE